MLRVGARLLVAKIVKLLAVLEGVMDFIVAAGRKAFCTIWKFGRLNPPDPMKLDASP